MDNNEVASGKNCESLMLFSLFAMLLLLLLFFAFQRYYCAGLHNFYSCIIVPMPFVYMYIIHSLSFYATLMCK